MRCAALVFGITGGVGLAPQLEQHAFRALPPRRRHLSKHEQRQILVPHPSPHATRSVSAEKQHRLIRQIALIALSAYRSFPHCFRHAPLRTSRPPPAARHTLSLQLVSSWSRNRATGANLSSSALRLNLCDSISGECCGCSTRILSCL